MAVTLMFSRFYYFVSENNAVVVFPFRISGITVKLAHSSNRNMNTSIKPWKMKNEKWKLFLLMIYKTALKFYGLIFANWNSWILDADTPWMKLHWRDAKKLTARVKRWKKRNLHTNEQVFYDSYAIATRVQLLSVPVFCCYCCCSLMSEGPEHNKYALLL